MVHYTLIYVKFFLGILEVEINKYHVSISEDINSVSKVYIRDRGDCKRAFIGDEVVVQLYPRYEYERIPRLQRTRKRNRQHDGEFKRFGYVVGIVHRPLYPHQRSFICRVNPNSADTGLLLPIRKGLPFIRNLAKREERKGCVTVYEETGNTVTFDRYERVNFTDRDSHLYIVKYLKWKPSCTHPLGAVIESIPSRMTNAFLYLRDDFENAEIEMTDEEYQWLEKEVQKLTAMKDAIIQRATKTHKDERKLDIFTIDPAGAVYLDDAFSIEENGNETRIGVHIADVTEFVARNSQVDIQARKSRRSVFYENETPVHMLPPRVSQICSILPNQESLAVSIYIDIKPENTPEKLSMKISKPVKTIITSKKKFSYEQVERLLNNSIESCDPIQAKVVSLYRTVNEMRKIRLGNESYCLVDDKWRGTPKSHQMVKELMIVINHSIAVNLKEWFEYGFPVKYHRPPLGESYENWFQEFEMLSRCCFPLRKALCATRPGNVCTCSEMCQCMIPDEAARNTG